MYKSYKNNIHWYMGPYGSIYGPIWSLWLFHFFEGYFRGIFGLFADFLENDKCFESGLGYPASIMLRQKIMQNPANNSQKSCIFLLMFIIFVKLTKIDGILANKKLDIRNTICITPGFQNIDFNDFRIVYNFLYFPRNISVVLRTRNSSYD